MIAVLCTVAIAQLTPFTVEVEGDGYLRFAREGRVVYAKSARLIAWGGKLAHESGAALMPLISLPEGVESVDFSANGEITVSARGSSKSAGRLLLARFPAGSQSSSVGGLLAFSQRPALGYPGEGGLGTIRASGTESPYKLSGHAAQPVNVATAARARIEAQGAVELDSARIRLGDLARLSGPEELVARLTNLDLGPTPALGVTQRVAEYRVVAALKAAQIEPKSLDIVWTLAPEVRRKSQAVSHERFVAAARAALGMAGAEWSWDPKDSLTDFFAPLGELELKAEDVAANGSQATVRVAVFVDGKRINSRTVRLQGDASATGVKSGSAVKVRFVSGGVVGEIAGRARSTALLGQSVEVQVAFDPSQPPSHHLGTVVGPGLVEVKLP